MYVGDCENYPLEKAMCLLIMRQQPAGATTGDDAFLLTAVWATNYHSDTHTLTDMSDK
jgi:hypothetical protein